MAAPHNSQYESLSGLPERKQALRASMREHRPLATPRQCRCIRTRLLEVIRRSGARQIAAVWPLPGEIDLRPLCGWLHHAGYDVLLPQTPPRGQALRFRRWFPSVRWRKGRFGTCYPDGRLAQPELILVPLLVFDRQGGRLGYGGGYYDRTLAACPAVPSVGYALASQECDQVPMEGHDYRLGMIVTENSMIQTALKDNM